MENWQSMKIISEASRVMRRLHITITILPLYITRLQACINIRDLRKLNAEARITTQRCVRALNHLFVVRVTYCTLITRYIGNYSDTIPPELTQKLTINRSHPDDSPRSSTIQWPRPYTHIHQSQLPIFKMPVPVAVSSDPDHWIEHVRCPIPRTK
jgi:hypothetical protein